MRTQPDAGTDPDAGLHRGRSVARRFVSPDGLIVLVGRTATDNDILTFDLADPQDFWLHVGGTSGSHVIVRNPERLARLPRDTVRFAAMLAARHSRARAAGKVPVHLTQRRSVRKPRGVPPGTVTLTEFATVRVEPLRDDP
jgi:predicted ribosome quality control (RQC) complex YloA/Tae2 family protein